MSKYAHEKLPKAGLSILYRIGWQVRRVVFTVFGPAQLGASSDPVQRIHAERRRKSAAAVAAREQAARDKAARDKAARDKAARDKAASSR